MRMDQCPSRRHCCRVVRTVLRVARCNVKPQQQRDMRATTGDYLGRQDSARRSGRRVPVVRHALAGHEQRRLRVLCRPGRWVAGGRVHLQHHLELGGEYRHAARADRLVVVLGDRCCMSRDGLSSPRMECTFRIIRAGAGRWTLMDNVLHCMYRLLYLTSLFREGR